MITGRGDYRGKENKRKRKAEQEADIGRAPGAERPRQLPLHRIARDLPQRSNDGEGNPERGDGKHGGFWLADENRRHRGGCGWSGQPERRHDRIAVRSLAESLHSLLAPTSRGEVKN